MKHVPWKYKPKPPPKPLPKGFIEELRRIGKIGEGTFQVFMFDSCVCVISQARALSSVR